MTYYVYILKSLKDNKHYTGSTKQVANRFLQHYAGHVKSTKNRRPLKIIYTEIFSTKQDARKREHFLKSGQGREELKKILNNQ